MNKRINISIIFKFIFLKLRVEISGQEQGLKTISGKLTSNNVTDHNLDINRAQKGEFFSDLSGQKHVRRELQVRKITLKNRPPGLGMWLNCGGLVQYVQGP